MDNDRIVTHLRFAMFFMDTRARGGHCGLPNASEISFGKDDRNHSSMEM